MQYVLWHAHVNNDAPKKTGDHAVAPKHFASASAFYKREDEPHPVHRVTPILIHLSIYPSIFVPGMTHSRNAMLK